MSDESSPHGTPSPPPPPAPRRRPRRRRRQPLADATGGVTRGVDPTGERGRRAAPGRHGDADAWSRARRRRPSPPSSSACWSRSPTATARRASTCGIARAPRCGRSWRSSPRWRRCCRRCAASSTCPPGWPGRSPPSAPATSCSGGCCSSSRDQPERRLPRHARRRRRRRRGVDEPGQPLPGRVHGIVSADAASASGAVGARSPPSSPWLLPLVACRSARRVAGPGPHDPRPARRRGRAHRPRRRGGAPRHRDATASCSPAPSSCSASRPPSSSAPSTPSGAVLLSIAIGALLWQRRALARR